MKQASNATDADLRLALRDTVARLGKPTSPAELRRALPRPYQRPAAELARLLAELARDGGLCAVKEGRALKYADRDPAAVLGPAIEAALREGPLGKKDLTARVKRSAPGFAKLLPGVLAAELARGAVREHPRAGKAPLRYGLTPPDPAPYLGKITKDLAALQKKLGAHGVTAAAIHAALGRALGVAATPALTDAAGDDAAVLAALHRLAAGEPAGALLGVRALRALVTLDKDRFDRAALRLARAGRLKLHHHDFPESLPAEERAVLVRDERGVHYIGVVPVPGGRP
jgi:hypothetical protein